MRLHTVLIAAVCGLGFVLADAQVAQPTQNPTVIRAESRQVIADTIVTDKKGDYVRDLTAKDFHIWEDGKEQTIESVIYESGDANASAPQYIVLFFDLIPMEDQVRARDAAVQLIQANAGPKRPMALVNYQFQGNIGLIQNFTTDAERLKQAAQQLRLYASPAAAAASNAEAPFFPGPSVVATPASSPTGITPTRPGDSALIRNAGKNNGSDLVTFSSAPNEANSAPDPIGRNLMLSLMGTAKTMASIPGRKALLWLNTGFRLARDNEEVFKSLIVACNKANVTLYPVNVGHDFSRNEPLRVLASETGGMVATNNDIAGNLQAAVREQSEHYLIAYTPPKTADKSCHELRVKVDRPGTNLRARNEYCNILPNDPLAGTGMDKVLEAHAAAAQAGNIGVSAQIPYFYTAANKARVHITAEVSPAELNFVSRSGRLHSSVYMLGVASKPDGTMGARFTDQVDFDFDTKKEVDQFKQQPFRYSNQFEILTGSYKLQLVFTTDNKSFGKLEMPLAIDPFDGTKVTMSSAVISTEFRASSAAQGVEAVLAANRVPLISRGVQFTPAAKPRMKKTDHAALYFEVYEPLLAGNDTVKIGVRYRILERNSGESKIESNLVDLEQFISTRNPLVPVALTLPVDRLTPGAFRLQVQGVDSAGQTTPVRSVDFDVE